MVLARRSIRNGGDAHQVSFYPGGTTIMNERSGGHKPGDYVSFVGYPHPLTPSRDLAIGLLALCGMRPDNYSAVWQCFFEGWDEFLKSLENSLFEIAQIFC